MIFPLPRHGRCYQGPSHSLQDIDQPDTQAHRAQMFYASAGPSSIPRMAYGNQVRTSGVETSV